MLRNKTKMSEQLTDTKPNDYLDIGGTELELPVVQRMGEALNSGETFIVVGGGGSGKTESLVTAFEEQNKSYEFFDLRDWTVSHLADEAVRGECLADPNLGQRARDYFVQLDERLGSQLPSTNAEDGAHSVEEIVKSDYLADQTYGVKYAEAYLLDREIKKIQAGPETPDSQDDSGENSLRRLTDSQNEVLVLDEFDLSIGESLAPVEIETATKLVELAKLSKNTQLGLVIHPPARKDGSFTRAISGALAERGEVKEIIMEYFPEQVEVAVLASIGLDGEPAAKFMHDVQGLPSAYLDICTSAELRGRLLDMSPEDKFVTIEELVEEKVAKNKKIIFDRLTPETQRYLMGILTGSEEVSVDPNVTQEALTNLYISSKDGNIYMPPAVKRVLSEELGIDKSAQDEAPIVSPVVPAENMHEVQRTDIKDVRELGSLALVSATTESGPGLSKRSGYPLEQAPRQPEMDIPDDELTEVVYHGSPRSFKEFSTEEARRIQQLPEYATGNETTGIYFTDDKSVASMYATLPRGAELPEGEGQIRMARLHFEHPYVTSDYGDLIRASYQKGIDALEAAGYDGFIYEGKDPDDPDGSVLEREFIAFDKDQIYSPWTTRSVKSLAA